jgi:hypothetical protein
MSTDDYCRKFGTSEIKKLNHAYSHKKNVEELSGKTKLNVNETI